MVNELYWKYHRLYCSKNISHNRFIKKDCVTSVSYDSIIDERENRIDIVQKEFWAEVDVDGILIDVDAMGDDVYPICQVCGAEVFRFHYFGSLHGEKILQELLQKYLPHKNEPIVKEFMSTLVDFANYELDGLNIPFRGKPENYGTLFSDYGIKVNERWFAD